MLWVQQLQQKNAKNKMEEKEGEGGEDGDHDEGFNAALQSMSLGMSTTPPVLDLTLTDIP